MRPLSFYPSADTNCTCNAHQQAAAAASRSPKHPRASPPPGSSAATAAAAAAASPLDPGFWAAATPPSPPPQGASLDSAAAAFAPPSHLPPLLTTPAGTADAAAQAALTAAHSISHGVPTAARLCQQLGAGAAPAAALADARQQLRGMRALLQADLQVLLAFAQTLDAVLQSPPTAAASLAGTATTATQQLASFLSDGSAGGGAGGAVAPAAPGLMLRASDGEVASSPRLAWPAAGSVTAETSAALLQAAQSHAAAPVAAAPGGVPATASGPAAVATLHAAWAVDVPLPSLSTGILGTATLDQLLAEQAAALAAGRGAADPTANAREVPPEDAEGGSEARAAKRTRTDGV